MQNSEVIDSITRFPAFMLSCYFPYRSDLTTLLQNDADAKWRVIDAIRKSIKSTAESQLTQLIDDPWHYDSLIYWDIAAYATSHLGVNVPQIDLHGQTITEQLKQAYRPNLPAEIFFNMSLT